MRTFVTVVALIALLGAAAGLTLSSAQASLALANAEGYSQTQQPSL